MTSPIDGELLPPSGEAPRLPSLGAPNDSIEFLSRLKEIIEVMLGRRGGSNWDRVVTFRDLQTLGFDVGVQRNGAVGFGGTAGVASASPGARNPALAQIIEAELRNSAAFKQLLTRIGSAEDLAQYPEEIRSVLRLSLDKVARERQADIQTVEQRIQTLKLSMASRLEEITAALEGAVAGVRKFDVAYTDRTQAIALQVTQLAAAIESGGGVNIEERFQAIASEIDGLQGQWSIKIQTSGTDTPVIAGIALAVEDPIAGPGTSSLIFMAEKFGFVTQNGSVTPFTIVGDQITFNGNVMINGQLVIGPNGLQPGFEAPDTKNSDLGISTYRVIASGSDSTSTPGPLGVYINGSYAFAAGVRGYTLVAIRRSDGEPVWYDDFDVIGNGATSQGNNAATLAAVLNSFGPDVLVILCTSDEPMTGRTTDLFNAMYRCGASRNIFGAPQFAYRGAYVLVGIPGCGEGNGAEAYMGGGINAWCDVGFSLVKGAITGISGATTTGTMGVVVQADRDVLIASKLSKAGNEEISGQKSLTSQYALMVGTVNDGIIYGSTGMYGRKGGLTTFSIGADGTAIFAGQMIAAYGTVGAMSIAAGGHVRMGMTAYAVGSGFFLGDHGGVTKFAVGNDTQYLRYDPALGLLIKLNKIVLAPLAAVDSPSGANGTRMYGTRTLSVTSGGTAPFKYEWYFSYADGLSLAYTDSATVWIYGTATNDGTSGQLIGRVTDDNGLTESVTCSISGVHGSPP